MMMQNRWSSFGSLLIVVALTSATVTADLPRAGDLVYGLSVTSASNTMELVRGPASLNGGAAVPDIWNTGFIQSVEFDNFGGISHNANGNLLGVNFGTLAAGGSIYSFSTTDMSVGAGQLIGTTGPAGMGGATTLSRLGGLSVSPSNNRIAVSQVTGGFAVYTYTAGNTAGSGASLSNARETSPGIFPAGITHGTTWLNNDTVLAFTADGAIWEIDAVSMASTAVAFLNTLFTGSQFTDIEYNPSVSPYIYASYGTNISGVGTTNKLFVLNPAAGYSLVKTVDLSGSMETMREIALDAHGNLYMSQYGGSEAPGAKIDLLLNVTNPASLTDNSSIDWYMSSVQSNFNGMDVAVGGAPPVVGPDFNMDGLLNCLDVDGLTMVIAAGTNNPMFDLTGDGFVNSADLNQWLSDAGDVNIGPGRPYKYGDATLDGVVDGSDFGVWNSNKFTAVAKWCSGDFNADGSVDGSDFGLWNSNKFTASDGTSVVPEPLTWSCWVGCVLALVAVRRRS